MSERTRGDLIIAAVALGEADVRAALARESIAQAADALEAARRRLEDALRLRSEAERRVLEAAREHNLGTRSDA